MEALNVLGGVMQVHFSVLWNTLHHQLNNQGQRTVSSCNVLLIIVNL